MRIGLGFRINVAHRRPPKSFFSSLLKPANSSGRSRVIRSIIWAAASMARSCARAGSTKSETNSLPPTATSITRYDFLPRRANREYNLHVVTDLRASPGTNWLIEQFIISNTVIMQRGALFLDRDGVINVDRGYVHHPEQFEFTTGIFELARFVVNDLCWGLVVVTNQSGIGRGFFDESAYDRLTRWMCDRFAAENAPITKVYHCPYHPEFGIGPYRRDHPWRKPKPGMILQAAADLDLDLLRSAIIGDSTDDMVAGAAAGVGLCIRLGSRNPNATVDRATHEVVINLAEALALLRSRLGSEG
jgi:D-glycero-D-manno-heptose 1,7-bisphosphate phosphatase